MICLISTLIKRMQCAIAFLCHGFSIFIFKVMFAIAVAVDLFVSMISGTTVILIGCWTYVSIFGWWLIDSYTHHSKNKCDWLIACWLWSISRCSRYLCYYDLLYSNILVLFAYDSDVIVRIYYNQWDCVDEVTFWKRNDWCWRSQFSTVRLYWDGDNLG